MLRRAFYHLERDQSEVKSFLIFLAKEPHLFVLIRVGTTAKFLFCFRSVFFRSTITRNQFLFFSDDFHCSYKPKKFFIFRLYNVLVTSIAALASFSSKDGQKSVGRDTTSCESYIGASAMLNDFDNSELTVVLIIEIWTCSSAFLIVSAYVPALICWSSVSNREWGRFIWSSIISLHGKRLSG